MVDILIVEDNEELAQLLCSFLHAEHYTACIAKSGEEALCLYEQCAPRLVILDVMLPGMDGLAVCKRIRDASDTPILMVSAKNQKQDQLSGIVLGADDYIEKPYDIDILLAKISNIFRRRFCRYGEVSFYAESGGGKSEVREGNAHVEHGVGVVGGGSECGVAAAVDDDTPRLRVGGRRSESDGFKDLTVALRSVC